jgi:uncharacterized 2Fe-2S/4Fe-4S cluster protein (DUF4445 family)
VVIDVPASSQVHRQVVRKEADARVIELDPVVRLHYVQVKEPDMHDPSGDLRRLFEALESEWQPEGSDLRFIGDANPAARLRKGAWQVTVAVHAAKQIIGVWPGLHELVYGLAVDVGSTTIAAHLCDLSSGDVVASAGVMNPQIRFGEDLMSRVSYSMMNPGGAAQMTAAVREALCGLAADVARQAGISHEDILEATLVGNPIMHHLLLGIDPVELGGAPFALAVDHSLTLRANVIDFKLNRNARIYVLPCIAGHVGADAAGMVLAERPDLSAEMTCWWMWAPTPKSCSATSRGWSPAPARPGPAFEGAQISCGQRAAPGAIERVRIDRETLEPRFKVIGSDLWSDEPGFAAATAATGVTGVCGSGIIEVIAEMYLAGIINQDGVLDGSIRRALAAHRPNGRTFAYVLHQGAVEMKITQNDVRAIQLAKAALYAGIALLMERLGVEHVDRIRLAGAFGSHIDVKYAMVLGMIPDCDLSQVRSAGNAAGTGARIALLDSPRAGSSKRWSGASKRWRPPSSRASSSISSRPWRFRTRPPPTRICARSWICPRPRNPAARPTRGRRPRRPGYKIDPESAAARIAGVAHRNQKGSHPGERRSLAADRPVRSYSGVAPHVRAQAPRARLARARSRARFQARNRTRDGSGSWLAALAARVRLA